MNQLEESAGAFQLKECLVGMAYSMKAKSLTLFN